MQELPTFPELAQQDIASSTSLYVGLLADSIKGQDASFVALQAIMESDAGQLERRPMWPKMVMFVGNMAVLLAQMKMIEILFEIKDVVSRSTEQREVVTCCFRRADFTQTQIASIVLKLKSTLASVQHIEDYDMRELHTCSQDPTASAQG